MRRAIVGMRITWAAVLLCTMQAGTTTLAARVPVAAAAQTAQFAALHPSYQIYTVGPRDTVSTIARRFHDVAWLIRRRNGGLDQLPPGSRIRIWSWPFDAPHWVVSRARTDHPQWYTVRAGDSLWLIAQRLRTTIQTLTAENGLADGRTIYPGQRLVLHHYGWISRRRLIPPVHAADLPTNILLTDIAHLVGTDPALVKAMAWQESEWQMVRGASGEIGMVQIMPDTARWVERDLLGYSIDPEVPENNVLLGTVLLAYYMDTNHDDAHRALALYHSGNTAKDRRNASYVQAVLSLRDYFSKYFNDG